MLDQAILKELKQVNVGKDAEKTKSRLRDIWMSIEKSQREEILQSSGLKKYTVEHSYKNGNISAKLALTVAQVLKINPNYLTGGSDEREEYSDEIVRRFLVDTGYGKLLELNAKPKRQYNRKKSDVTDTSVDISGSNISTAEDTADLVEDTSKSVETEEIPVFETPPTSYDALISRIQDKVRNITESEQEKIDSMPGDTAEQLLKGLYLRTEYSEEAKRLAALLKIILTL